MFSDAFVSSTQLIDANPRGRTYLAAALIIRGDVEISDVRRNIDRVRPGLKFAKWNTEAWKIGICSIPPIGQVNNPQTPFILEILIDHARE
jgi:tubulin epsilon